MRIAICDDDSRMSERLAQIAKEVLKTTQIETYEDGNLLLAEHAKAPYQIVLLAIEMPAMDGMTLAGKLREKDENLILIFVTDCCEMVYRCLSYAPLRFVRKDYIADELEEALLAAGNILAKRQKVYMIEEKGTVSALPIQEISYIEVKGHTATIYTQQQTYGIRKTMNELQMTLEPDGFIRTHVGYLVNVEYIYSLRDTSIQMQDGTEIPMSRAYKKSVRERFFMCLGGGKL